MFLCDFSILPFFVLKKRIVLFNYKLEIFFSSMDCIYVRYITNHIAHIALFQIKMFSVSKALVR